LIALFFPAILYFRRRRWALGIYYLAGMGLLKLSVSLWKHLISRPRPEGGLEITTSFSMPSGHAANAVLIFGMLGIVCLKASNPFGRWLGFTVCLALVFLIGFSRVYLGVHYPSDVLLGSLYAASGLWLLQFFRKDMFNL
jgi:undecaprenyl-diphosphatase